MNSAKGQNPILSNGWVQSLLFLLGVAVCVLIEAAAYSADQLVGDNSIWLVYLGFLIAAFALGTKNGRGSIVVAVLGGMGLSGVLLQANLVFLGWYRVEMLNNFDPVAWRSFQQSFAIDSILVSLASAAAALAGALWARHRIARAGKAAQKSGQR